MRHYRLEDMRGGWFVGGFQPTALASDAAEVAVKQYREGDREAAHVHRVATEVTLILEGEAVMAGRTWRSGDIVVLDPGEPTDFAALTDVMTVVVKLPSVPGDKYPADAAEA